MQTVFRLMHLQFSPHVQQERLIAVWSGYNLVGSRLDLKSRNLGGIPPSNFRPAHQSLQALQGRPQAKEFTLARLFCYDGSHKQEHRWRAVSPV
jgi:hypothetical protein